MINALLTIVPVFCLVLSGYLYRRLGIFERSASLELNRFVVYFALPLFLLDVMINATWSDANLVKFVVAFCLCCGIVFAATLAVQLASGRSLSAAGVESLCASYPNMGYIGFPICILVFGKDVLPAVTLVSTFATCILFATALAIIELARQPEAKLVSLLSQVGISVLKNPLVSAPLAGAAIGISGIALPESVHLFLNLGSSAASPCALVSLGVFLAESNNTSEMSPRSTQVLIIVSKLIVLPVLTLLVTYYVFGLPRQLVYAATLLAALPTGTGPFMVAQLYQLDMSVTGRAIFWTTTLAVLTLSLLLFLGGDGAASGR
jgi:malonate transporter